MTEVQIPCCISPVKMRVLSNTQMKDEIGTLLFIAQVLAACITNYISAKCKDISEREEQDCSSM